MRLLATLAIMLALGQAAAARDIALKLTDEEQRALYQILDTATKAGGIETAKTTVYFLQKIATEVNAPPPVPPPSPPAAPAAAQ